MGYRRSHSQLAQYTRCSEQFRLKRFVKGLPQQPAAWLAVGSAFHTAYEQWEINDRTQQISDLFETEYPLEIERLKEQQPDLNWWGSAPNVKSIERDIELRGAAGVKQAVSYQDSCEQSDWKILRFPNGDLALELKFEIMLGVVSVLGYIDTLLEWPDGRVTVRDLKTGNKGDPDNRQLGLYRAAAKKMWNVDLTNGEYWYTKLGASGGWVDLRRYSDSLLEDYYVQVDKAINQQIFIPNPGKACGMCDVRTWCREIGTDPR